MVERSIPLMPLVALLKMNSPLAATPIVTPPIIADLKSVWVAMCMFPMTKSKLNFNNDC